MLQLLISEKANVYIIVVYILKKKQFCHFTMQKFMIAYWAIDNFSFIPNHLLAAVQPSYGLDSPKNDKTIIITDQHNFLSKTCSSDPYIFCKIYLPFVS